jgi:hypothetical protein
MPSPARHTLLLLVLAVLPLAAVAGEPSAEHYVRWLYAALLSDDENASARYSPRLDRLWADCEAREAATGDACVDFSMFVMGNDFDLSDIEVHEMAGDGQKAVVQARFKNFGVETSVTYDLVHDKDGWMIDEMTSGRCILSEILEDRSTC